MGKISIANVQVDRKEIMQQMCKYMGKEVERNRECAFIHNGKMDLAVFDCTHEPGLKIDAFVAQMSWLVCTEAWLMGGVLVERFLQNTMGSLGPFNAHRLLITSLMIAVKQHADVHGVTTHFAKNLSMRNSDLNRMERVMLCYLDWETVVTPDQLAEYVDEKLIGRPCRVPEQILTPKSEFTSFSVSSEASSSSEGPKTGNLGRLAKAIEYVRQRKLAEESVQKRVAQTPVYKRVADTSVTTATW